MAVILSCAFIRVRRGSASTAVCALLQLDVIPHSQQEFKIVLISRRCAALLLWRLVLYG